MTVRAKTSLKWLLIGWSEMASPSYKTARKIEISYVEKFMVVVNL